MNHKQYFKFLLNKSFLGNLYRRYYLFFIKGHVIGFMLDLGSSVGGILMHRPNSVGMDINPHNVQFCINIGQEAGIIVVLGGGE
jgi:hypothetical protein